MFSRETTDGPLPGLLLLGFILWAIAGRDGSWTFAEWNWAWFSPFGLFLLGHVLGLNWKEALFDLGFLLLGLVLESLRMFREAVEELLTA